MRKPILVSIASILALIVPSVAGAQCVNGQCSASAYGYYPMVPYYVAPRAYAPRPPFLFRQHGGSGRIYGTWGDPGALTAWIVANDPARPAAVAVPVPDPPVPEPSPPAPPPVARIKVKVHYGRYDLNRLMQMLRDAGLSNAEATYESGYPIYGEIDPARLNALRSLPGVTRIEVVK